LEILPRDLVALLDLHGIPQESEADLATHPHASELISLAKALRTLRAAVDDQGAVLLPIDAETNRVWEPFLQAWVRPRAHDHGNFPVRSASWELMDLIKTSLGAQTGLLCPRRWDW